MKLQNFLDELLKLYEENKITKDTLDSMNFYASRLTDGNGLEEILDNKVYVLSRKEEHRYLFNRDSNYTQPITTTEIKYRGNKYMIITDDSTNNDCGIRYTKRLFSEEGGLLGETIINEIDRSGIIHKGFKHDFALHEVLFENKLLSKLDFLEEE